MRVVCPSCDREPPKPAAAGVACEACGASLVKIADPDDLIGAVIDGRFEILATLGKGGMGTVYRAKQRSIGREVALKLIDRRFDEEVTAVKRFLREAKLASQLAHPNTVGVIEFGQSADGRLYLAMELVRGQTLHELLQTGPLPLRRVVRIGIQLCDALEAAHALSIVHRDLKLENVMLLDGPADRDLIKVLDFGLARSLADVDSRATATGMITGTPRYLAPEVALGGAAPAPDQDLYALGVLLGELASGRTLWEAPTIEALFTLKLHGKPSLDALDPVLRELVEQLLAIDPHERPTAAQARGHLSSIETGSISTAATVVPIAAHTLAPQPTQPLGESALIPVEVVDPRVDSIGREPTAPALPSAAFVPPGYVAPAGPNGASVELDADWQREKAGRIAVGAAVPSAHPKRSLVWGVVGAVLAIAVVVTVVVIIGTRPAEVPPTPARYHVAGQRLPATANTVSIEIRADPPADVTVDGNKAGRTPFTIHVQRRTGEVLIEAVVAGHPVTRTIVPDRDQTVELRP